MSTFTSPDGILIPATSDTDAWQTLMAAQAGTIQDAFDGRQVHTYRPADAAALAALSGTYTLQEGDKADQLDTDAQYRWSGSAWVAQQLTSGMNPVIPTSATGTGVSLGASGKVTMTATPAVTVNGCFISTYENYLLLINIPTGGAGNHILQLAAGGTLTSAANYDTQVFSSSSASVTAGTSLAATSWSAMGAAAAIHDSNWYLYRPQLAVATVGDMSVLSTPNPMTTSAVFSKKGFLHRLGTSYDGFVLTTSSGTFSGSIRVYGYNNN
jgi:hypothetical protein